MHRFLPLASVLALSFATAAVAAPCKDAAGKFVKCPTPAAAKPAPAKPVQCKDAKGKFIKCPAPATVAAKPAQCKDAKGKFIKCPASPAKKS